MVGREHHAVVERHVVDAVAGDGVLRKPVRRAADKGRLQVMQRVGGQSSRRIAIRRPSGSRLCLSHSTGSSLASNIGRQNSNGSDRSNRISTKVTGKTPRVL